MVKVMIVMVHIVMVNFLCRMVVRRMMVRLIRDVLWAACGWLRTATWWGLLVDSVLFVQIGERSALLAGHLLELQKNLLLGEVGIVGLRRLLEWICNEIQVEGIPRIQRAAVWKLDHIGHERLCKGVLELRNPSHGRCHAFFSSLKFFDAELGQLLLQSRLPLLQHFFSHDIDVRSEVAFHSMQLIGDVRLHLSQGELLAHRNEVLPLLVVAQMLLPDSLTDEKLVPAIAMSRLDLALDAVPRAKSHLYSCAHFVTSSS